MRDNKLIAEFMGLEYGDYITPHYHCNWNELMPVVEKCYESGTEENEVGDITHALLDCDIDETHKAVVEFINQLNKES